jgi:hypothetical protein
VNEFTPIFDTCSISYEKTSLRDAAALWPLHQYLPVVSLLPDLEIVPQFLA